MTRKQLKAAYKLQLAEELQKRSEWELKTAEKKPK